MASKNQRPWLTSTGIEVPATDLKAISKTWSNETWEAYLKWFTSARVEARVSPEEFDDFADRETETVFETFCASSSSTDRLACEKILSTLPHAEAHVLRLIFFEGKTEREIAIAINRSQPAVHQIKRRAFSRIRRGLYGDEVITRPLLRGECSDVVPNDESLWARTSELFSKEEKIHDPSGQQEAFANIQSKTLKDAIHELSERQKQIIYLRFWCDFSLNEIAREMRGGVNLIEQVLEAAISKTKRTILRIEESRQKEGGPECA